MHGFRGEKCRGGWEEGPSTCNKVRCLKFVERGVGKGWVFGWG